MKRKSPISLFSFQDIITSLTGIMIVVVLVILLQLVEAAKIAADYAKMLPEYKILKKTYDELLLQKENLNKKIIANAESSNKFSKFSVEDIKKLIKEEEIFSKILDEKISKLELELSNLNLKNVQKKIRIEEIKTQLHKLSKKENEIRELETQLLSLKEMKKNISNMIVSKRKVIRIEFSGYENQTPLLIECNDWGFRCQQYPDGEVITLGNPHKGSLSKQLSSLAQWLNSYDKNQCYAVLLFKEKSLPYYNKISETLYSVFKTLNWGQEVIGNDEEIFQ